MDNHWYLSVMDKPTADGTMTIGLQSYGTSLDATVSTSVPVLTTDTETAVAAKIQAALTAQLRTSGALYAGQPTYVGEPPLALWQVTRTEHTVCIWGNCQFECTFSAGTPGVIVSQGTAPCFVTLRYANRFGKVYLEDWINEGGQRLQPAEQTDLIQATCAQMCAALNNNVCMSTYTHYNLMNYTSTIVMGRRPVVQWDVPRLRTPGTPLSSDQSLDAGSFSMTPDGFFEYRDSQDLIYFPEPFAQGLELAMTYQAGEYVYGDILKNKVFSYLGISQLDPTFKKIKHGTFGAEMDTLDAVIARLRSELIQYVRGTNP